MSEIFVPSQVSISPKLVDGFENLLTRVQGLTTNSLVFATIGQVELVPRVFSVDQNNARVEVTFFGQIIGVAGTKQFRGQVDGVTFYTTASANQATNPGSFEIKITVLFRNNLFIPFLRSKMGDSAGGGLNINSLGSATAGFAAFDPSISHTVTLQALVANAGDSIVCNWIGGSFR